MKIIVDAFGGDNAPDEIIKGCKIAQNEYKYDIILSGDKNKISKSAKKLGVDIANMDIIDAPDVISADENPTEILKSKKDSSMGKGLKCLSEGVADGFVSAGNSGALVVASTMIVKRIKGVSRCAFAPVVPKNEGAFMLLDSGANSDCRADMLRQFGIMGSVYMQKVMGVNRPKVAIANVGTEDNKGDSLRKSAFKLLSEIPKDKINFIGNIEARDIPMGNADVVVTDGFTGNIILKLYEGMGSLLFAKFKDVLSKNIKTKFAASLILPDIKRMKKDIDYNEYGGAPIIGVSKPVFKAHGSSNAVTIKNAIRLTAQYIENKVVDTISSGIGEIESTGSL